MYLPRLFSIVLYACLGETTIPLVSWAWGAFGISYTKKNHYNFASRCCEERQSYYYTKTWSWDVTWLFWRKFMTIRPFSDPVRVLSIGRNPIQVLSIRSDPVRVLSIRSDPIRSGPDFVDTPNLGTVYTDTVSFVTPSVSMRLLLWFTRHRFVIRTVSFWIRFPKWSVFERIRFHWSCKRRNRIDVKAIWRETGWLAK